MVAPSATSPPDGGLRCSSWRSSARWAACPQSGGPKLNGTCDERLAIHRALCRWPRDRLHLCSDPLIGTTNRTRINILSLVARLPTVHGFREHVEVGGLISCSERDARDDDFARGRMKRCFHQNCPSPAGNVIDFRQSEVPNSTIEPLKLMQRF
jgi:hypothetical protein